ncbi:MAG: ABC transporter permease [Paludibacteraceae bacterium]|nr:ABC transporter permease [Paludibacteraceae bacterium]
MNAVTDNDFDIIIKPKDKLLSIDFREIYRYRDLYLLFVRRDITTMYKQTLLGPLWFLITPVLSVIVYVVVFGGIANISTDGAPAPLFYLLGIALWGYFSTCLNATSNSFVTNASIFGKVYFPRIIMPLVAVTTNLVTFAVQMLIFFVAYVWYILHGTPLNPNAAALLFPILLIILALTSAGFGMVISSMTTKYRDLQLIFTYIVNLWMYVTPVIYPLSAVTNPTLRTAMSLNPITPVIEAFKYGFLGVGSFSWLWLAYSLLFMLVLLSFGIIVFNRTQKSFMDTV